MEHGSVEEIPISRPEKSPNKKLEIDPRNLKFFKEEIFQVPFDKLGESASQKYLQHVFVDEDDYEDFKQDLINFHHLRSRWKDDRKKVSKDRSSRKNSLADCEIDLSKLKLSEGGLRSADDTIEEDPMYENLKASLEKISSEQSDKESLSPVCQEDPLYDNLKASLEKLSVERGIKKILSSENLQKLNSEKDVRKILSSENLQKLGSEGVRKILSSEDLKKLNLEDADLESLEFPIMEFFQNDEHFQEFDRVFETVKNKRRYASNSSLDKYRWSPHPEDDQATRDGDSDADDNDADVFDELKINDIFSDFFDNDSAFKNFEEEFENFQGKRYSKVLERSWHRNSVCDLIEDLKAFCDPEDETKGSNDDDKDTQAEKNKLSLPKMWNNNYNNNAQGGEWDYIFSKLSNYGKNSCSENSGTGKSDLTVKCDSESGNNLLEDLCDSDSNRDTGYYSEAKYAGDNTESTPTCTCPCKCSAHNKDCQFTCHHKCLSSIQLDCKSMSHEPPEDESSPLTGETSLSDLSTALQSTELSSEPATEKDETDSGYQSGTIPDEKLPHKPSQATLNREELKKRLNEFNKLLPGANFALKEDEEDKESFQGFIKVVLNLVRPISMSLGARPPSIYEVLTREHIVEQNTQNISFYMPRDTVRSIHAHSHQPAKEVITLLLKKFHILDHPRKFALYEQELKNNKIAKLRRLKDHECPLKTCVEWDLDNLTNHRLVLQENEAGEIDWEAFCVPELNNFMRVLDKEQEEYEDQLKYKYKVMRRLILQRMKELRIEAQREKRASMVAPLAANESQS